MHTGLSRAIYAVNLSFSQSSIPYIMRCICAAALALLLGFYLELDAPFSAASTVLLLINPTQGAVVGKGLWRAVGTLVGVLAAFALMSFFTQKMLLFVLGLSLWLGFCVGAMTLVRHYYATAVVVAGYTVSLALGPAIIEPEGTFQHVITRASAVVIGVICLSIVAIAFTRRGVAQRVHKQLVQLSCNVISNFLKTHTYKYDESNETSRGSLAKEIYAVDDLIGVGRAESPKLNSAVSGLRAGMRSLFSSIAAISPPDDIDVAHRLSNRKIFFEFEHEFETIATKLQRGDTDFASTSLELGKILVRLFNFTNKRLAAESDQATRDMLFLERLHERLEDLIEALQYFSSIEAHSIKKPILRVEFHRNYNEALRNAARATLAILVGAAVWFFSGWDQGPTLLAVLGPYCTLLAGTAYPSEGTMNFIKGTIYAIPAALICKFLLLPLVDGYVMLVLVLSVFWAFGIYATTIPKRALQGIAYLIAFNTLVATSNVPQYEFVDFANQSCAWILALCISLLSFKILPKSPSGHLRSLIHSLHAETLVLLRKNAQLNHRRWSSRQQHLLAQLGAINHKEVKPALRAGLVSLQICRELSRIQHYLADQDNSREATQASQHGLFSMGKSHQHPALAAAHAKRAYLKLKRLQATGIALMFGDLSWLLKEYTTSIENLKIN
ncbi:FUSC family protein [Pseudomonas veronii]|uniref:FUSC family protein n=1 Tax=Pseudomonas veronii TaxID=76761 RepID=UPI002D7685D0|nr:FUSC family protein [Pseudomonas veronii]WRU61159.1 FUSC family protein [Pseudomonas veronii]